MKKQIYNNNLKINYTIEGSGSAVVLVHGFLETSETWKDFGKELSQNHLVISPDLPGHGESELYKEPYSMCKYAESIYAIIKAENISKVLLAGHSMGGYVALAFAENYMFSLSGLCLFHSSPFADSEEKKKARDETISRIERGNKHLICSNHAKAVFADENIPKFKNEIERGKKIANSIPNAGIIASLKTMKGRIDRNDILETLIVPFLYIKGKKDRFISEDILQRINFPEDTTIEILENSGHMGMIEEKEKSLKIINDFCNKINR